LLDKTRRLADSGLRFWTIGLGISGLKNKEWVPTSDIQYTDKDLALFAIYESGSRLLKTSVVDPDPEPNPDQEGFKPFCSIRIRIRMIGSDPEPKGSECQFYVVTGVFML